jgi:hypothetical protein
MKYQILLLSLLIGLSACQKANDKNPALLGKWKGVNWLIFDKPSDLDAAKVHFEFREDGTYNAQFGTQDEKGVWRTVKDKLYTKGDGKQEIMVKLLQFDGAKLNFEMNRGGQKETLEMVKE